MVIARLTSLMVTERCILIICIERFKDSSQVATDYTELSLSKGEDKTCSLGENVGLDAMKRLW